MYDLTYITLDMQSCCQNKTLIWMILKKRSTVSDYSKYDMVMGWEKNNNISAVSYM